MLRLNKAYEMLEELCAVAETKGMDVNSHYATIIECLRRLDLVATISLATDTSADLTDSKMLEHISRVVFDDTKLLYAIECTSW